MTEPHLTDPLYGRVMQANVELHSTLAAAYNTNEPHFRPENVAKVEARLEPIFAETAAKRLLDLGCGTGFMIDIAKRHVAEIHGVDVTPAMIERVDTSGDAEIVLHLGDSGSFEPQMGAFDVVTAYSFLHHLGDVTPTLRTAFKALRPGGKLFVDLEPNSEFWAAIGALQRDGSFDEIVSREIEMVSFKDEDIRRQFGVDEETFNLAEYGKSTGGFSDATMRPKLLASGFSQVEFFYTWFIGQGQMINDSRIPRGEATARAETVDELLQRALPLSRELFKYIGFVATR